MEEEEQKRVTFSYGVVTMLRTRKGLSLMDRLGKFRITKPLAWFMLFLMPVSAAIIFYVLITGAPDLSFSPGRGRRCRLYERSAHWRTCSSRAQPVHPMVYGIDRDSRGRDHSRVLPRNRGEEPWDAGKVGRSDLPRGDSDRSFRRARRERAQGDKGEELAQGT